MNLVEENTPVYIRQAVQTKEKRNLIQSEFLSNQQINITYVTWSRGMSRMSLIFILSYRLKEVTNPNVLHCLEIQRFAHISGTRFRLVMGFGSKCRILNGQVDYFVNSNWTLPTCDSFPLIVSHIYVFTYYTLDQLEQ